MNIVRDDLMVVNEQGLVPCAKPDRDDIKLTIYSNFMQIEQSRKVSIMPSGGIRKPIKAFTRKSRLHMLKAMAKIRNVDCGRFITLTYPDSVAFSDGFAPAQVKRDLSALRKRIARDYPQAGGIWRIEFKARKSGKNMGKIAPHVHILLFGVSEDMSILREYFRKAWFEVAHNGDENKGRAGTQIDPVKSRRHATYYVSKYLAKPDDSDDEERKLVAEYIDDHEIGRWWAVFGNVDQSEAVTLTLTYQEFIELRRLTSRWLRKHNKRMARRIARSSDAVGFSVFGLGDQSHPSYDTLESSAIMRLLAHILELTS